jgi:predicted Zn finger-like uncharacterized protein
MIITVECPHCHSTFPVDPAKVPVGGVKVRCSSCAGIFRVEKPREAAPPRPPVESPPPPPPAVPREPPSSTPATEEGQEEDAAAGSGPEPGAGEPAPEERPSEPEQSADPGTEPGPGHGEAAPPERDFMQEATVEEEAPAPRLGGPEADEPTRDAPRDAQVDGGPAGAGREVPPAPAPPADDAFVPAADPPIEAPLDEAPAPPEPEAPAPTEAPAPKGFQFGRRDPKDKAKRLARVLVSDIVTYNPERHARALEKGTLHEDFEEEIQKSWAEYVDQVGREIAEGTPYFTAALNDILARGEPVFED